MKKVFFSLVAAIVAATATYAQSTLVATLTHGENVSMYYGTNALRDAHEAAVSGDVINLSGGAFQAVDITKALTLRGAGIDAVEPTYIINEFRIDVPSQDTGRLSMEGIRCSANLYLKGNFSNPYFLKSQFVNVYGWDNPSIKNAMFVNCKITGECTLEGTSTGQFVNCYLGWFTNMDYSSTASFINCIIRDADRTKECRFVNSIIYTIDYGYRNIQSTSVANNCVAVNYTDFFMDSPASSGCTNTSFNNVFKTFTGTYSDEENFELTDAAKTTYLGTDGTQVGLYGGVMPYTSTPSYPQITKMNVANKTTADGKLSVEIEVSAAQ